MMSCGADLRQWDGARPRPAPRHAPPHARRHAQRTPRPAAARRPRLRADHAARRAGPYDDEKLGLNKVAKYYYYPGFWEGGAALGWLVNIKAWEALPAEYRAIFTAAAHEANAGMMAKYDARNGAALRRLIATGTIVKPFPKPVMEGFFKASQDMYRDLGSGNAAFKKMYDSYAGFQKDVVSWMRVTENTFDDFISSALRTS